MDNREELQKARDWFERLGSTESNEALINEFNSGLEHYQKIKDYLYDATCTC